nr:hypothetical protein [Tanacetum cinerariifolium]
MRRYIDIKPNRELIHYCIENKSYQYKEIVVPATPSTVDDLPTREEIVKETYATVSEEIRKKIDAEAEAVHIILIEIDNDIYSTVDACPNAKAVNVAGNKENIDEEEEDQELEAHYVYMAKIQEMIPAAEVDNGPNFNKELMEKVYSNDDYNVFTIEKQHVKKPESINDTYAVEKDDNNITLDSLDMRNDKGKVDLDTTQEE